MVIEILLLVADIALAVTGLILFKDLDEGEDEK